MSEPSDLSSIERRISSVRAVEQVINAIWALGRAQLPLAERAAARASAYLDWVDDVVARIAGAPVSSTSEDALHVVLGPERAYCGALPRRVLEQAPRLGRLGLVGNRLIETARLSPAIWSRVVFALTGATTHEEHELVGREVAAAVLEHGHSVHVELHWPTRSDPSLRRCIILAGARLPAPCPPDTYSPLSVVLDAAVAEAVSSRLSVGVAEALCAEIVARIAAAERARSACKRKADELTLALHATRQAQITSELMEVVVGAEVSTRAFGPSRVAG